MRASTVSSSLCGVGWLLLEFMTSSNQATCSLVRILSGEAALRQAGLSQVFTCQSTQSCLSTTKDKEHNLAAKTTQFLVQARENLSRQMSRRHFRYPTIPTTPGQVSPSKSKDPTPQTTPSTSFPPTISSWTSANLFTSTNSRMAKLAVYIANLTRQGFQLHPPSSFASLFIQSGKYVWRRR